MEKYHETMKASNTYSTWLVKIVYFVAKWDMTSEKKNMKIMANMTKDKWPIWHIFLVKNMTNENWQLWTNLPSDK